MKNSIFPALFLCFFSVSAFGQFDPGRRSSEFPSGYDPFEILELQMRALNAGRPDNHPVRDWNDNGSALKVSLKELQHKIPKQAIKEYNKGVQALNKGNFWLARERLQNAINIDPDFADAHNDLGVALASIGQTSQSVTEFQKAVDLSPTNTAAVTNLNVELYVQQRYHEVCELARLSLSVDPTLTQVRYVFALSLIADHGDSKEALTNLDRAAREYPDAYIAASNLLVRIGQPDEAARHLEAYLRSSQGDAASKAQVEARLAQLRQ